MYIKKAHIFVRITPEEFQGNLAATTLNPSVSLAQGVFTEAILTAFLVTTIIGSTNKRRKGELHMATIPIGFAVSVGVLSGVRLNTFSRL